MHIMQLAHNYNEKFKLEVENLKIPSNTIIGLVGENGAGKTTLMSILSGFLEANEACTIEYDCDDYKILFIPSDVEVYDFLTVKEFLRVVKKYSFTTWSEEEMLNILDLADKSECTIDELSQGMKKKLTLIPIFLKDYDLIILDEPFNSIDMGYIYKLKKILLEKKKQSSILISSHILETLVDLCDDFVILSNGSVTKQFKNNKNVSFVEGEIFERSN